MDDSEKTKEQLLQELAQTRRRIAALEHGDTMPRGRRSQPWNDALSGSDISSREWLERALLVAAQQWRATFDAIYDAVCVLDAERQVVRCNQSMADLVDVPYDGIVGQTCHSLVHHTSAPVPECPSQRAWITHRRETAVMPVGDRWFNFVADPMLDEDDRVMGMVHIMVDITDRRRSEQALRRRNHELLLLNQAAQACSSTLNPTEVLLTILKETCHLLDVVSSSIWLLDAESEQLVCQDATGPFRAILRGWRLSTGEGIVGRVAASGDSLIVPDTRADPRYYAGVDQKTGLELRSIIGVPLKVKGQVIGVLEVVDSEPDRLSTADLRLLEPLAATAATAIDNARLYERAQQEIAVRKYAEAERERVIAKLQEALTKVKTLSGLLPMCANCKKIRDDQGYWQQVEVYVREHSEADFSHGLCPDCAKRLYPSIFTDTDF